MEVPFRIVKCKSFENLVLERLGVLRASEYWARLGGGM